MGKQENKSTAPLPKWFLPVAIIGIFWNFLGLLAWVMEMTASEEIVAMLSKEEKALYTGRPFWANIAFTIAVFASLIGSVGLALRRQWSPPILGISLLAVVVQMFHSLVIAKTTLVHGTNSAIMPILVIAASAALFWLSGKAYANRWLK